MPRFARFLATIARIAIFMAGVTACGATVSAMPQAAITADAKSAESLLHAHGLEHHGHAWCLPQEIQLHSQLDGLERLEQRLIRSQQAVDQLLAQNDFFRQEMIRLEQVEKEAHSHASATAPGSPQRAQYEAESKAATAKAEQCRRKYVRPSQLGMLPPLKFAMADLIAIRTDIMLRLLSMRREMEELTVHYDALRHESGILPAIVSTGPESLGALQSMHEQWKLVDKLQPLLFGDSLPVAREGKSYCVTLIVNERQPLTFSSMGAGPQQFLIPQNLAEACGLAVSGHAPKVKLHVAKGRDVVAWRTKISQLRFGRHAFRDVDAYVLPPEAADIGARIGAQSLAGYHPQLDNERLTLTLIAGK
jgi:gag-polyprotein putative aspartyl protease